MDHISKHLQAGETGDPSAATSGVSVSTSGPSGAISKAWPQADRDRAERLLATLRDPTQPGATPTSRGVLLSSLVPADAIGTDEAVYLARRCSVSFSIDHAAAGSLENQRVWEVWEQAQRDGWTAAEFTQAVDAFVLRQKFPTWTVADFFAVPRPKVYGHPWYREQVTAGRGAEIGRYVVVRPNGEPQVVWGWRSECDGLLEEHRFSPDDSAAKPKADEAPVSKRPDVMPADVREQWDAIKEAGRAGAALDEEKRTTSRLRSERTADQRRIDALEAENAALRLQIENLTALAGRSAVANEAPF